MRMWRICLENKQINLRSKLFLICALHFVYLFALQEEHEGRHHSDAPFRCQLVPHRCTHIYLGEGSTDTVITHTYAFVSGKILVDRSNHAAGHAGSHIGEIGYDSTMGAEQIMERS